MNRLMGQSGFPKRFLTAHLKDFQTKYDVPESDQGFYITGKRGVGKTHLLAAICKHKIAAHLKANANDIENKDLPAFISVPELLFQFKQSYSKNSNTSEDEILNKYTHVRVLALDDLGAERSTDWAIQLLYLLVNRRYSDMRQTFISSNLPLDQIASQLDDRIASRIAGMCDVVEIQGQDRRIR